MKQPKNGTNMISKLLIFLLFILPSFITHGAAVSLETDVTGIAQEIKNFANINLGAKRCQEHFDKISSQSHDSVVDATKILNEFKNNLDKKTELAKKALKQLYQLVLAALKKRNDDNRELQSCCTFDNKNAKYDPIFKAKVDSNEFCEKGNNTQNNAHIFHSEDLLKGFKKVYEEMIEKHGRDIYFGAADGYSILYPARSQKKDPHCSTFDPRYQEWYKSTLNEEIGKDVVLVFDFTQNMKSVETTMRYVIKLLLQMIDTKDRIAVKIYGAHGRLYSVDSNDCLKSLTVATHVVIKEIQNYIDQRQLSGVTIDYVEVFDKSFKLFEENDRAKQFIFVSSGNYVDKEEDIRATLQKNKCLYNVATIIILLGPLGRDNIQFHEELIQTSCGETNRNQHGKLIHVYDDTKTAIRNKLVKIYDAIKQNNTDTDIHFTMPYGGNLAYGVLINACRKVASEQKVMLGILCISFITNELVGGSSDFPQSDDFYRFLTDTSGTVYMHLNYREPTGSEEVIIRLDIGRFETSPHFQNIYASIKRGTNGRESLLWNTSIPRGSSGAVFEMKNYTYHWTKVENSQFVIGVVISSKYRNVNINTTGLGGSERYYRLDFWNKNTDHQFCTIDDDVVAKVSSVIKFSPDSFERPSVYSEFESKESVENLMKYFGKFIDFVPPPSLFRGKNTRENLRESVISTHFLQDIWLNDKSPEGLDILARYIGMETGMFRIYPAIYYHHNYDPRVRGWYRLGIAVKDKIVLTQPYLDAGTGLAILTLAKAIYKGKGTSRQVIGVIGMDFLLPHLQLLVQRNIEGCQSSSSSIRCVLFDRNGFVIYHEKMMTKTIKDGETSQLAVFEPRVFQHLISRKYMKRQHCVQYCSDGSLDEWFFSLDNVENPIQVKEKDLEYWISPIYGTNVLLLKIYGSYQEAPYKCSRQCSNVSNESCSCLDYRVCLAPLRDISSTELLCKASDHRNTSFNSQWYHGDLKHLPKCYDLSCGKIRTSALCEDRLSCQWCAKYPNGSAALLDRQYCALIDTCFRSVEINQDGCTKQPAVVSPKEEKYILIIAVLCIIIVLLIGAQIWRSNCNNKEEDNMVKENTNVGENNNRKPNTPIGPKSPEPPQETIYAPASEEETYEPGSDETVV